MYRLWSSTVHAGGTHFDAFWRVFTAPNPPHQYHRCHLQSPLLFLIFLPCRITPTSIPPSIPPLVPKLEACYTIVKKMAITWNGNQGPTSMIGLQMSRRRLGSKSGYLRPGHPNRKYTHSVAELALSQFYILINKIVQNLKIFEYIDKLNS